LQNLNNIITKTSVSVNQDIDYQLKSYASHKQFTHPLSQRLNKIGKYNNSEAMAQCGHYLQFQKEQNIKTLKNRHALKGAYFCKHRFCPICSWRKSTFKVGKQLFESALYIQETDPQKYAFVFLTLTVPNPKVEDLGQTIKHINQSFQRLSQTKSYKNAVSGHFKALEILGSNTPDGQAHPHLHVLLMVKKSYFKSRNYISQQAWLTMWQKATRDISITQVDIRRIKPKGENTALTSAIYEVAKYSVKHTDLLKLNENDFSHIINQTHKIRFHSFGGILKQANSAIKKDPQLLEIKAAEKAQWISVQEQLTYTWNYITKNYA
jgi:plasmid rolling circle replication initiator protein Rep